MVVRFKSPNMTTPLQRIAVNRAGDAWLITNKRLNTDANHDEA